MTVSDPLDLERFLPYRLSVLSNRISKAVARLYEERFDLKLPEWRVMAVLGRTPERTASQIAEATAMDKVAISRAVKRLMAMDRLSATGDASDARKLQLRLSPAGEAIYAQIVPLARQVEETLLASLEQDDRLLIDAALTALTRAAARL